MSREVDADGVSAGAFHQYGARSHSGMALMMVEGQRGVPARSKAGSRGK